MRDFTLRMYESLVTCLIDAHISVYTVKNWILESPTSGCMIRHDVDRRPRNSLAVAELESALGLRTSYYFRITRNSFDQEIIRSIADLGHEIGYHYEDLALAKGDFDLAARLFGKHLQRLRAVCTVETAAMHGGPLSGYNNLDLWKTSKIRDFGLIGEAFLTPDYTNIYYFTDTGRSWSQNSTNLRDHVDSRMSRDVASTTELADFLTANANVKAALVMHPERWDDSLINWWIQAGKDLLINGIKLGLKTLRR